MIPSKRLWPVFLLLSATALCVSILPRSQYTSPNIIPHLQLPTRLPEWSSKEMTGELNLEDERYKFVSDVFARLYKNTQDQELLFLVLDAGNFHHPKVCFESSGFEIRDLPDTEFVVGGRTFAAHTLYAKRREEGFLVIYWMSIDGKLVDWTEQKLKQFWFSLSRKQRVGLMARLDIPTRDDSIERSVRLAQEFLAMLGSELPDAPQTHLFGESS